MVKFLWKISGIIAAVVLLWVLFSGIVGVWIIKVPAPLTNKTIVAKAQLGKELFFDPNLSNPAGVACGTCHKPELGFTDGLAVARGVYGREGTRNTPTIVGSAFLDAQFWDGREGSLEAQANFPIFNKVEMNNTWDNVIKYLEGSPHYKNLFKEAFGEEDINQARVVKAIAAYERTVIPKITFSGPVSKLFLSSSQKRGREIFFGKGNCFICHKPPLFTDSEFHNTGVAQVGKPDLGRYLFTGADDDFCRFKTPSLINVALTAPYSHAGRSQTLEQVVEFYNRGGDLAPAGKKSEYIKPLHLTTQEKEDLVNFLKTLRSEPTKD